MEFERQMIVSSDLINQLIVSLGPRSASLVEFHGRPMLTVGSAEPAGTPLSPYDCDPGLLLHWHIIIV